MRPITGTSAWLAWGARSRDMFAGDDQVASADGLAAALEAAAVSGWRAFEAKRVPVCGFSSGF